MSPSWLSSPAVTLAGLAASVVTLGQVSVAAGRGAIELARAADKRSRVALVLLAVAVVSLPLTWQTTVTEVGRYGEVGLTGALYPVSTTGLAIAGALVLYVAAIEKRAAPWMTWPMMIGGLALTAGGVILHHGLTVPSWA